MYYICACRYVCLYLWAVIISYAFIPHPLKLTWELKLTWFQGSWFTCVKTQRKGKSLSCPTLCDPMDCSLPGFSVHGIFQARVLEWVAISFSRGSSWPRDRTRVSHIVGRYFTHWATREAAKVFIKSSAVFKSGKDTTYKFEFKNHVSSYWPSFENDLFSFMIVL